MNRRLIWLSAILALALAGCDGSDPRDALPAKMYYIASTSMEPTFSPNERLMAWRIEETDLARGDVVIVRSDRGEDYILRLVALPGDTVQMVDGQIMLNETLIEQVPSGRYSWTQTDPFTQEEKVREGALLRERLPGSAQPHYVLDIRPIEADNTAKVALGDSEYFMLGDNRDAAADSRFAPVQRGLGIVQGEQITRRIDLDSIIR